MGIWSGFTEKGWGRIFLLEYKSQKWEKRKERIIQGIQYDYDEIRSLKNDYLNGKVDEIKYHYMFALILKSVAEDEFVQGKHRKCYEYVLKAVEEFSTVVKLLNEGKDTKQVTRINIENKIKGGYFGYLALLTSNYAVIPQVTEPESSIARMLSGKMSGQDVHDPVDEMEWAISLREPEKFEKALADRIREIRRFDLDCCICADFISIALVREAKKRGMRFYSGYIEADLKDGDIL